MLVVEDESLVAMLVEDLLTDLGHEVVAIGARLEEATQLARELVIDLAVVDLNLNGEHSYPVAEALAARNIPIVFATGYGGAGLKEEWRHAPVLQKPFQPHELAAAIVLAIGR